MKIRILALLGLLFLSGHAFAQQGVALSKVVGTCGSQSLTPGGTYPVTVDAKGNPCPALPASTPANGATSTIATGGTAVTLITGPIRGCYVVNPMLAADEGIATAEGAYVNPVSTATTTGNGTTSVLSPGQGFSCPLGMTTSLSANAATSGHKLNVVKW